MARDDNRNNNRLLVPGAQSRLDALKYEVASELSHFPRNLGSESQFRQTVDRFKYEVANELGIPLSPGYNGDLTTRQAGRIGGRIGGKIGGQMVKRMIALAEQQLASGVQPPRA